jgi:hypothetical protein
MRFRLPAVVVAFSLMAVLPRVAAASEPSACTQVCKAMKKACPESCKESGTPKEQERCLAGCPADIKDCEKHCPAMEARARSRKLGDPAMDIVQIPHEAEDPGETSAPPPEVQPPEQNPGAGE